MTKIKDFLFNKYVDYKLKKLSETRFIARNTYTTTWKETGSKTYGRIDMFETLHYAMYKVYGRDWNIKLRINGFQFTEDENGLYLRVFTFRPGQLIGKMGSRIDELAKVLSLAFLKDTEIRIEETTELYGLMSEENY